MTSPTLLRVLKAGHTLIWAFFVLMICSVWLLALREEVAGAAWAIAIVMIEVAALGLNHGRCPLGGVVARHTDDRAANFDIYLPEWLASRTKPIFGSLFAGGIPITATHWAMAQGSVDR